MNTLFLVLLLAHCIGDFYVQTKKQSKRKEKSLKWVFLHCLFYSITMFLFLVPFFSLPILGIFFLAVTTHCLIDIGKYFLFFHKKRNTMIDIKSERNIFFGDQGLHLLTIGIIYNSRKN